MDLDFKALITQARPILPWLNRARTGYALLNKAPIGRRKNAEKQWVKSEKRELKQELSSIKKARRKRILKKSKGGSKVLLRFAWEWKKRYF